MSQSRQTGVDQEALTERLLEVIARAARLAEQERAGLTQQVLQEALSGASNTPARQSPRRWRFHAWNTGGKVAWHSGKALHRAGLRLCGFSGTLDAIADRHR